MEDDLFEIEKVIDTKRVFNDDMAKTIQIRMREVGERKMKEDVLSFSSQGFKNTKKEHPVSDMNVTVSGYSGFGLANKNKDIPKIINTKN